MRRSVLFALAIVCCLSSACGSTSTSSTTSLESKSPAAILALAQKAINDAHWSFRFQDETRVGNSATTITGDESATTAVQSLSGSLPTLEITRTADGDIYLHGNANALVSALGLSQAAAAANAGHWIALTPGDAPYAKVAGTLEPQDEVDPYLPQAHLRMVAAVHPIDGHSVVGVEGTASSSAGKGAMAAIFVSTKAPFVPLGASLTLGQGSNAESEVVFGDWGERVAPSAPLGAVAYSTLAG